MSDARNIQCNTVQHTQCHCSTLQHTVALNPCQIREIFPNLARDCLQILLMHITFQTTQYTATKCNKVWHTSTHCNTLHSKPYVRHCNTLQHTATHCSTLQHTAAPCNTLHSKPYAGLSQACLKVLQCDAGYSTGVESLTFLKVSLQHTIPPSTPTQKKRTWKTSKVSCSSQIWRLMPRGFVSSFSMEMLIKMSRYPAM